MDIREIGEWVMVGFVCFFTLFIVLAGVSWAIGSAFNGQTVNITGNVALIEQKSVFGAHTDVTFKTLGGEIKSYTFIGYQDFGTNTTITINAIQRPTLIWGGPFAVWLPWCEVA